MAIIYNRVPHPNEQIEYDQYISVNFSDLHSPTNNSSREYTAEEKIKLRPICETLALINGTAFFDQLLPDGREWYEQWLPKAAAIFYENGCNAFGVSWIQELQHETPAVADAWLSWRTLKTLSKLD